MNMPNNQVSNIPPLIATSVVRGSAQGESHGGVYIVDSSSQSVLQMLDWDTAEIDWSGRGWDRGLRGIAFWNEDVYIAASDEVFVYDQQFNRLRSFRNRYLKHCHEIAVHDDKLYLTSTGFDSILAFDLNQQEFIWGLHAAKLDGQWHGHRFDPRLDTGPPPRNQHHINNVDVNKNGLSFAGLRTGGIIGLSANAKLEQQVELPDGVHNARLTEGGVIFNDTAADIVRLCGRDGDERHFALPKYDSDTLQHTGVDDSAVARQGFGRGLCMIDERFVAAGSSPSTVTVFDIHNRQTVWSVNFSMDIRNAIHGLEVWPYPLPDTKTR